MTTTGLSAEAQALMTVNCRNKILACLDAIRSLSNDISHDLYASESDDYSGTSCTAGRDDRLCDSAIDALLELLESSR